MQRSLPYLFVALGVAFGCARAGSDGSREGALVNEGSAAPAIETIAHNGERVSLAALKGKPVVIYFYPKDDTPGCTKEACEIRDAWSRFRAAGAVVLGVSTDDSKSHVAFADKYHLPFLLLPDPDKHIAKAYGVPIRLGTAKRVTFVVDPLGNVAKVFPDVSPKGHAEEILAVIEKLKG
jgi:peroxiredoxin Q/BCP